MPRLKLVLLVLLATMAFPQMAQAAKCSDFSSQAAAQQAANTRDADGDGIYCESLPCPCSTGSGGDGGGGSKPAPRRKPVKAGCQKPDHVVTISFSKTKYPNIRAHYLAAVTDGWPRFLVLNRLGADARRDRLLADFPTKKGYDRDEYPPAIGRGRGFHIRGINPRGWMASVRHVPSSENRSHGSRMGIKLRRFCNGTMFRYGWY